jgi:chromosome segregation ATPase
MNHAPYLSEAEELLLYLNQQPERTASRDALCAQFPDAETQVDEMVNQGLLEFSDWQLEQVRGDASRTFPFSEWKAVQLTAKGSIHSRDVQARQTKEQEKQHRQDDETQKQTQAQQRLAEALEQMRKDFVNYQAEQARKEIQNELEHAKINEKNRRSAWLQVIFTAIFSPLAALFVEHFQDIVVYFRMLFHC